MPCQHAAICLHTRPWHPGCPNWRADLSLVWICPKPAFDKVKRQVILDALADAGASQADIELVASLHRNSMYVVKYGSSRGSFRSTTGIKQGCKLAPSLFSPVTSFIFQKVGQDVSAEEVEGFLTGFADDLIVHKDIYCWRDLEIAHQLALSLLAHLEAAGFSVNSTKCCVMYRLKGRLLAKVRQLFQYTEMRDGKAVLLWRLTPHNHASRSHRLSGYPTQLSQSC